MRAVYRLHATIFQVHLSASAEQRGYVPLATCWPNSSGHTRTQVTLRALSCLAYLRPALH